MYFTITITSEFLYKRKLRDKFLVRLTLVKYITECIVHVCDDDKRKRMKA